MPTMSIQVTASGAPSANKAYRTIQAVIPASKTHFTPSLRKNHGSNSKNNTSDIWPNVILNAGLETLASLRKTGTYAK